MMLLLLALIVAAAAVSAAREWRDPSGTGQRGQLHLAGMALVPLSGVAGVYLALTAPEGMGGLPQATFAGVLLTFFTAPAALALLVAEVRVRAARRDRRW